MKNLKRVMAAMAIGLITIGASVSPCFAADLKDYSVETAKEKNSKGKKVPMDTADSRAKKDQTEDEAILDALKKTEKEEHKTKKETLTVYTTAYLNVRLGPGTEAERVNVLPPNTELNNVHKVNDDWYSFDFNEKTYNICCHYVTKEKPNPAEIIEIMAIENTEGNYFRYKKTKEEIQRAEKPVQTTTQQESEPVETQTSESVQATTAAYSGSSFRTCGVIWYNGYKWTWYSQRILPGGGLDIPGRHVDESGYVCDGEGYICIASCDLAKGTVIDSPLGKPAKVYDYCPTSGTIDTYTNW